MRSNTGPAKPAQDWLLRSVLAPASRSALFPTYFVNRENRENIPRSVFLIVKR